MEVGFGMGVEGKKILKCSWERNFSILILIWICLELVDRVVDVLLREIEGMGNEVEELLLLRSRSREVERVERSVLRRVLVESNSKSRLSQLWIVLPLVPESGKKVSKGDWVELRRRKGEEDCE